MEYERIHKVQTGIISPSKLRMKLMGAYNHKKKDGSNNSSRTSPSKLEDTEFVRNSLLATENGDFDVEVTSSSLEARSVKVLNGSSVSGPKQSDLSSGMPNEYMSKENGEVGRIRIQQCLKDDNCSSSTVHPSKSIEDENLDYDSNASSSSFEFHKGERSVHSSITRSYLRPMSSKWNDAEKWIMNRQNNGQANHSKKNVPLNHGYRMAATNLVRVAPESANSELRSSVGRAMDAKQVDFFQSGTLVGPEKFSFVPAGTYSYADNVLIDPCSQIKDLKEVDHKDASSKATKEDPSGIPAERAVSMRDMGTEMTPVPSQEPSRTATPVGASPFRSPISSIPSTPRREAPAPTPIEQSTGELQHSADNSKKELTEDELKLKTRREIVALGMQLGKTNIAAWASKDEQEKNRQSAENVDKDRLERVEFEKRAAVWEEVEKSKHMARYKREEIKIQAWESQQKAKLEAEMRRVEAQVEQLRAQAQVKMTKKIALTRQKSEEKRTAAECLKKREAERTAAQVEHIRQTGRMPSSPYICCGWLS